MSSVEIQAATGIPSSTVRGWVRSRSQFDPDAAPRSCARCDGVHGPVGPFEADYAYVLGQYLGDGHVSQFARGVHRLRIACSAAWPGVLDDVVAAVQAVVPASRVALVPSAGCVSVSAYSRAWPCLLPQAGPGPKHERDVSLTAWQRDIVDEHPWAFLRGLIHSDGCRVMNTVKSADKTYRYPRYFFTNASAEILAEFCRVCTIVGVQYTRSTARDVSIARASSVALVDRFVGAKT